MERSGGPRARRAAEAARKRHRASPLPELAAPLSRTGAAQTCRKRLFGGLSRQEPRCKRLASGTGPDRTDLNRTEPNRGGGCLKGKSRVKTLQKITENVEVGGVSPSSDPSNQVNVKEATDWEKNEEKIEESSLLPKESLIINPESKENSKNAEMTSSTGMTLPTGVSTFLLECLDVDSTADYNLGDSDSCSSPETFRVGDSESPIFCPEDTRKYKNSTLLDSSKAVAIDKIPPISNLSAILEPLRDGFQDQLTGRKRPADCSGSSSALSVSVTLAGKKVCKITAARERSPDLKTGMSCSSPLGPERKPGNQITKEKEKRSDPSEEGPSSFLQCAAPGNTSAKLTAEVLPFRRTDAVVRSSTMLNMEENKAGRNFGYAQPAELDLSLSPVCKPSPGEDLFLNTTAPYVNSEEIVPASLSTEKLLLKNLGLFFAFLLLVSSPSLWGSKQPAGIYRSPGGKRLGPSPTRGPSGTPEEEAGPPLTPSGLWGGDGRDPGAAAPRIPPSPISRIPPRIPPLAPPPLAAAGD
ncbi:meiosis-specific kinetochore protein [Phaethornis superciliosus]